MPIFDTPEPIFATIELGAGNVQISAADRTDTVVDVRPSNEGSDADVRAAEQTRIEYANGTLLVKVPKNNDRSWFGWGASVDVTIALPADSRINATASADIASDGRLGESRFSTAAGEIRLDQTGRLHLNSGTGDISVARCGQADVTTGNGEIRIGEIDGAAVVKTANGDITLGEVAGELRMNTASGDITVDRALASVGAKTASGSVRIGEVVRGAVSIETASGELEVGVREGTAAWLDVKSMYGRVRSSLTASEGPEQSDEVVEVRARTGYGDIVIHRS